MESKKIWLYLDDVRTPEEQDKWEVVRNYDEFVAHIKMNGLENYEVISLDHDLGDTAMKEYFNNAAPNYTIDYNNIKEKTGLDCAKWMVSESMTGSKPLPQVYTHSANPIGAANIMGYVNNYLKNCRLPQNCVRIKIPHTIKKLGS